MDTIFIEKLTVDAIIGVYPHERKTKQPLVIDIEMSYDSAQAIASDNLKYALDYHQICNDIHAFVEQSNYQLIETLGEAIAQRVLNNGVEKVQVTLSKPKALDQAANVGIRIVRQNH